MEDPREAAYRFLIARERHRPPPDPEISPLASELAYGVLRHRSRLDWIIERATGRRRSALTPEVTAILRLGAYQILFTSSVPTYAAVSESVNLAAHHAPRAKGFVNWALRRVDPADLDRPRRSDIADPVRRLATRASFPPWMVRRWHRRFGYEEASRLLEAMNVFPPLHVRVNRLRIEPDEVIRALRESGGEVTPGAWVPEALHLLRIRRVTELAPFREGWIYIQDEASQLAPLLLSPLPGERILDACAGVGGKASHLAELMGDSGDITALDNDPGKLERLGENLRRLRISSVTAVCEDLLSGSFSPAVPFDRILLDAPCSGLGIIRRHPDLKWGKKASDVPRLADLQLRLMRQAAGLLAPGGTLAYSTCTIEPEENEGVVRRFLRENREYRSVTPGGQGLRNLAELLTPEGFVATFPHRHGMNGGFVAVLRRNP